MWIEWAVGWRIVRLISRPLFRLIQRELESYLMRWLCAALQTLSDTRTKVRPGGGYPADSITRTALRTEALVSLLLAVVEEQQAQMRAARIERDRLTASAGTPPSPPSPIGG